MGNLDVASSLNPNDQINPQATFMLSSEGYAPAPPGRKAPGAIGPGNLYWCESQWRFQDWGIDGAFLYQGYKIAYVVAR